MTLIDILISIVLAYFIFKGWRKGIIAEAVSILGIIAGAFVATHFSKFTADLLGLEGDVGILVAFVIAFVAALVGVHFLGKAIEKLIKSAKLSIFNKIGGAFFGFAKSVCLLGIILNFIMVADKHEMVITENVRAESHLLNPTISLGNTLTTRFREYVADARQRYKENHPEEAGADEEDTAPSAPVENQKATPSKGRRR